MQASARRKFHAEKRKAVLAFAYLVHRKNVRMIKAGYRVGFASEACERFMRIGLITQHTLYGDDPVGVSLARAVNHAHAAASDLVKDFVIAEVPLRIRHFHFSHDVFEIRSRYSGFESLAQETARTDSTFQLRGGAALLAFCRPLGCTRERIREPVRILH